jgi:hypothetical protein
MNRLGIFEEKAAREFLDGFIADFERQVEKSKAQTLLLSSEYFAGMTGDELKRLKSYLGKLAQEIVLIAYVRDPWSFSTSLLQQNLRDGIWKGPIRPGYYRGNVEILDTFSEAFRVKPVVRAYAAVNRRPFDVVGDFLCFLGIQDRSEFLEDAPKESNVAVGWKAACLISHVNELFPGVDAGGRYVENPARDWVVEKIIESCVNDVPIRISAQTARKILLDSQQDLARLHEVYLGGDEVFLRAYEEASFDESDDLISIDRLEREDLIQVLSRAQYAQAEERMKWMEEVAAMRATKSWRMTAPLRAAYRLIHR